MSYAVLPYRFSIRSAAASEVSVEGTCFPCMSYSRLATTRLMPASQ